MVIHGAQGVVEVEGGNEGKGMVGGRVKEQELMLGGSWGMEVKAREKGAESRALEIVLQLVHGVLAAEEAFERRSDMEPPRTTPCISPSLEDGRSPGLGEFHKEIPGRFDVGVRYGGRNVEDGASPVNEVVEVVEI